MAGVMTSRRHPHTKSITADAGVPSSDYRGKWRNSAPSVDQRGTNGSVGTFYGVQKNRPDLYYSSRTLIATLQNTKKCNVFS